MKRLLAHLTMLLLVVSSLCVAQETTVRLPKPDTTGGKPIMQCLKERKTSRSFDSKPLPQQVLSNLLWAAFGVNRPDGHRTAPSAMNWQEMDIYVAMQEGLYLYDANSQSLKQVLKEDIRGNTGTQGFVKDAPVDIVYVADLSKAGRASGENQIMWTAADCGFIAQNVYLYCASEGLACVVRGSIDKPALAKVMNLRPDQKIILSQTVGYPK